MNDDDDDDIEAQNEMSREYYCDDKNDDVTRVNPPTFMSAMISRNSYTPQTYQETREMMLPPELCAIKKAFLKQKCSQCKLHSYILKDGRTSRASSTAGARGSGLAFSNSCRRRRDLSLSGNSNRGCIATCGRTAASSS